MPYLCCHSVVGLAISPEGPTLGYARIRADFWNYRPVQMPDTNDAQKVQRYREQSLRFLGNALTEMRNGRWARSEELIWGSLTLAVKGVALVRGHELEGDAAIRDYALQLGQQHRDRRIREAFDLLSGFADTVDRVQSSRMRLDYLFLQLDDISAAVERLWELAATTGREL